MERVRDRSGIKRCNKGIHEKRQLGIGNKQRNKISTSVFTFAKGDGKIITWS